MVALFIQATFGVDSMCFSCCWCGLFK